MTFVHCRMIAEAFLNLDKKSPCCAKLNRILAQSSAIYLGKSGGCLAATNFSNQFPLNNILGPHTSVGMMRTNNLSKLYSFAGKSGRPLRRLHQSKGSVPVVYEFWRKVLVGKGDLLFYPNYENRVLLHN
ncbi:unnamed protein product [Ilex paraguariensis]|uniref:Uncharacterized protein n=1 Tax=Ilex paraguariensis TaxID=185542 RepID=A0ABC8SSA4_9AQUA